MLSIFSCVYLFCLSSSVKCIFMIFAHFVIRVFAFLLLGFEDFFYIINIHFHQPFHLDVATEIILTNVNVNQGEVCRYVTGHRPSRNGLEAGDRWAPGWTAGVCRLWTDTPRWKGEGAQPCLDKRPYVSHFQGQGDLPDYTCSERLFGGQKGEWCQPTHRPLG